ncbi:MAG: IS5 family transposase [Candidatus Cryptobacteroides sp.]
MIGKTPKEHQMSIFDVALESFIDMNHELVLLSKQIDWEFVEAEFAEYYCADNGRPSVPIRKMVGMMLLKNIYNLSDEGVVARWLENPYMQYFTGEKVFQKRPPMNPIDMTKFRKRIGAQGAEKIFKISLMVNAKEITAKEMKMVMIDSTVQEKNITFPTDAKLYRKIIAKVLNMSRKEDIELRRTYTREMKALKLKVRFMNHPTRMKEGRKAVKRMRTIARAMVNDISRKMDEHQLSFYKKDLELYVRVINQGRNDKDKVYSLHEPEVQCISKGKEHKKYEFGNKSAIAKTGSGLIVSALSFKGNPYDGHTLSAHWEQIRRLTGHTPKEILTDRGYRGKKSVGSTEISIPSSGSPKQSYYQKAKARKKFCKRAGIEPVIGHLKSDHRMMRNYLKGTRGDAINTLMAAAAYNMRHWMNKYALSSFVSWLKTLAGRLENVLFENENKSACLYPTLATVAERGV